MSAHQVDKKFPGLCASDFCRRVSDALRRDTAGLASPEKVIAEVGAVHPKTARYWLEGKHAPHSYSMARLVRTFENVRRVWNEAAGQEPEIDSQRIEQIKALLRERE